jgi:hypothetical protein
MVNLMVYRQPPSVRVISMPKWKFISQMKYLSAKCNIYQPNMYQPNIYQPIIYQPNETFISQLKIFISQVETFISQTPGWLASEAISQMFIYYCQMPPMVAFNMML